MSRHNSIALRYDYENAAVTFAKAFKITVEQAKRSFKMTQSYLRLEQPISTTNAVITFPVLANIQGATGQYITEQRLNQQDSFIPTEFGFYVAKPASNTDGAFRIYSYLNQSVFTNAGAMTALYNGQFKITVNNDVLVPAWDVWRHWDSDTTQQTGAFGAGSPGDEFHGSADGSFPMQPYVAMIGSKNIQINLTMPAAPTAVDANARAIIIMRGILAQNSTVVV